MTPSDFKTIMLISLLPPFFLCTRLLISGMKSLTDEWKEASGYLLFFFVFGWVFSVGFFSVAALVFNSIYRTVK